MLSPTVRTGRNRELDWLRAYAILFVLAEHATLLTPYPTFWKAIVHVWYEGATGVDLFFVISGYVICKSFVERFDRAQAERNERASHAAGVFYLKRIVRLGPAVAVWSAATFVASVVFESTRSFPPPSTSFYKLLAALFYVYNISESIQRTELGYLYSLSTEMQFYLILPIIFYLVRKHSHRLLLLTTVFMLGFAGFPGLDSNPVFRFSGILLGMILYLVSRSSLFALVDPLLLPAPHRRAGPLARAVIMLAALAIFATVSLPIAAHPALVSHVAAVLACMFVWAAIYERGYITAFGLPHVMDWIGTRSYSIYLCHIPVMLFNRSVLFDYGIKDGALKASPLVSSGALILAWIGGTTLCSELTFRLLERPFQSKANRIRTWSLATAGAAAPGTAG